MKSRIAIISILLLLAAASAAMAQAPSVTNVAAEQREGTYLVDITYDLACSTTDSLYVRVYFSTDGGASWPFLCGAVSGDVGPDVPQGAGRTIVWDARADYPGYQGANCRIRVVADDILPPPQIAHIWRMSLDGMAKVAFSQADTLGFAENDTVAYGEGFRILWAGATPVIAGMSPQMLAQVDTVYPFDDGLLGYQFRRPDDFRLPVEYMWNPKYFDEAAGDSVPYFGEAASMTVFNDGSGTEPHRMLLDSGFHRFSINAIDVLGGQVPGEQWDHWFVVNYDPQTIVLNGETDWAHPGDAEIYPYYVLLNDPLQVHHPFTAGERIPDRSYAVFKALMRDDARDRKLDPGYPAALTGYAEGAMQLSNGGVYSFQTSASEIAPPTWPAGVDGWSADTLGFLVAPSTHFTMNLRAVDEHGRRDGTPATLEFDVGYPPCVQCLEIVPQGGASSYDASLACYDPGAGAHPCFGDTATYYIKPFASTAVAGRTYLERLPDLAFLAIDRDTKAVDIVVDTLGLGQTNYLIPTYVYAVDVLMHGRDDAREAYNLPGQEIWRTMAWKTQMDYDCDPSNEMNDGGIVDNIDRETWGTDPLGLLQVEASGLWRNTARFYAPRDLLEQGEYIFRLMLYISCFYDGGAPDPDDPRVTELFEIATRQFGLGRVQGIALDQTMCAILPVRPGHYNTFRGLRPPTETPDPFVTWRDCSFGPVDFSLPLSMVAMESREGQPVSNYFRVVLQTGSGTGVDLECTGAGF